MFEWLLTHISQNGVEADLMLWQQYDNAHGVGTKFHADEIEITSGRKSISAHIDGPI